MFGALKRWFAKTEEVEVTVVSRVRSADRAHYTVVFEETGGERSFTQTFAWYSDSGFSIPRSYPGDTAILHINRRGKIVYAGSL